MQTQVEELYSIFNLEYRSPLYQEGCHMDCQQSPSIQHSLKTQVRREKHNGHTHSTTL
jgi:hypothetical protein